MKIFLLCALAVLTVGGVPVSADTLASKSKKDPVQVQTALSSAGVASQETNLGNLIADAVRETGHADIALVAADEIAETRIPAGSVPAPDFLKSLRYADDSNDTVVVLNLTGAQIQKAAERAVSRAPQPFDGFLQVSGLQIRYDPSQPEGKRVSLGGGIVAGQTYRVATTHPVANGSLGYFQVWDKKAITQDTGISISQSLLTYLAAHRMINATVEGRIEAR